jgi:hypothetical protein
MSAPLSWNRSYFGQRLKDGSCEVWVEDSPQRIVGDAAVIEPSRRKLPLHLEIRNHSPTGFEWGYGGSGPAQLALALLVDALGDRELAEAHYQDFKRAVVSGWANSWTVTAKQICDFVAAQHSDAGP